MHQINVSLIGVAVTDVRAATTEAGYSTARFRLVCRPRKFDAATGTFIDHEPSFVTVQCWRKLADHVAASVRKGDQVVVTGRMRVREWEQEGRTRVSVEIEAQSVGLDLARAPAVLQRPMASTSGESGRAADESSAPEAATTAQVSGAVRDVA